MRLATIVDSGRHRVAVVSDDRVLVLEGERSMREMAAEGLAALETVQAWVEAQSDAAWQPLKSAVLGPVVPDPGAIYTIGHNYRPVDAPDGDPDAPPRPLVYGKAAASVGAHGDVLAWDRSVTDNVDAEVELGVVMGPEGSVFGYTCINDVSSRDEWLDGDQWLLGKSMPGFCPVGPWIVTPDALDPADLRVTCSINGESIQDGRTSQLRFGIAEVIEYLGRHLELRPGDLIATGTPARLATPPGPGRRLAAGDLVTVRIEGIGELTTRIG
jgi:2-keto-4-pentenoate hydratase/2-oxohepta-3-ene-1,7-dioic acid hydratase in catechol pathway